MSNWSAGESATRLTCFPAPSEGSGSVAQFVLFNEPEHTTTAARRQLLDFLAAFAVGLAAGDA
ncbi:hypothetical protein Vqi01_00610 [Micromonospora qiuiae]|uniref:Uncharacterized protein n=1 Tax=Micromonospora qiuiae TaxID=502268 RepID=A0ABQ4J409_9ACTN|nr:hypothetical protein [Micromonospora qiuiae]GIJ24899.1 hypothetical protein Vqi01_00610 [Micromonospora qiuiae]